MRVGERGAEIFMPKRGGRWRGIALQCIPVIAALLLLALVLAACLPTSTGRAIEEELTAAELAALSPEKKFSIAVKQSEEIVTRWNYYAAQEFCQPDQVVACADARLVKKVTPWLVELNNVVIQANALAALSADGDPGAANIALVRQIMSRVEVELLRKGY